MGKVETFVNKIAGQLEGWDANGLPRTSFVIDRGKMGRLIRMGTDYACLQVAKDMTTRVQTTGQLTVADVTTIMADNGVV